MALKGILDISFLVIVLIFITLSEKQNPEAANIYAPKMQLSDYDPILPEIPAHQLEWYIRKRKKKKITFYKDQENGNYFKDVHGNFILFNYTFSLGPNGTIIKDPKGIYKSIALGGTTGLFDYVGNTTSTTRTIPTTTTEAVLKLKPPRPEVFQNFYMKFLVDNLPPLEANVTCKYCPRVYIPVCGSDGRSYTNVCKLNCMNLRKRKIRQVAVAYMGICQQYIEPYEY